MRISVALSLLGGGALAAAAVACATVSNTGSGGGESPDGSAPEGQTPPDTYVTEDGGVAVKKDSAVTEAGGSCRLSGDCTTSDKCQIPTCVSQSCVFAPRQCTGACTDVCDPADGLCKPKVDGVLCDGGECLSGVCLPPVLCGGDVGATSFLYCGSTLSLGLQAQNFLAAYTCGSGENGGETPIKFQGPGDEDAGPFTVTFTVTPASGGTPPDLDLLVLEGSQFPLRRSCTRRSACLNPVSGAGRAGITPSSTETVTVTLQNGPYYDIVVDSKTLAPGNFTISATCN